MPLYYYICQTCKAEVKVVADHSIAHRTLYHDSGNPTNSCGGQLTRSARGPNTTVHEVLDNGKMARAVERFSEAEHLTKERSKNHKP